MPSSGCKSKINQYTFVTFILALIYSGTPIRLENHRNNKWMIAELSPFFKKNSFTSSHQVKNMLKEAGISLSKSTAFMNANTEDLHEGVNHWLHSATGRLD